MNFRIWPLSLPGRRVAKYLAICLVMLALIVGTFTTNLLFTQPVAAATLAQQHTTSAQAQQHALAPSANFFVSVPNVLSWPLDEAEFEITLGDNLVVGTVTASRPCTEP